MKPRNNVLRSEARSPRSRYHATVGLRSAVLWLGSAALSWLAGCTTTDAFTCNADEQCVSDGEAGRCEAEGVCSFPDTSCPSGHRYGLLAGELAGECVGGGSTDVGTGIGSTSIPEMETAADESSGPPATSTTTTTSEPESTSEPGSMTSTTSTTDPNSETTAGNPLEPYGPCSDAADCLVEGSTCIAFNSSVCAPPCSEDEPCVYEGEGGSGLGCYAVGAEGQGCVFLCNGDPCPEGMICEMIKGVGYCGWA